MSHTDKDAPAWVRNAENGVIRHDHRHGVCVAETFDDARAYAGGFSRWGHHRVCRKYVEEFHTCTKAEPERPRSYFSRYFGYGVAEDKICWNRWFDRELHVHRSTQCLGHYTRRYDADAECVCDTWSERPTCTFEYTVKHRYYTTSTPDPDWERRVHYGPRRRAARDTLRELTKEYNAGSDISEDVIARREIDVRGRLPYWD